MSNSSTQGFMLRSPAKLNWTLEVLGKRADGFHELRSWFLAAAVYDELYCQLRDPAHTAEPPLRITGPAAEGLPLDGSNLVLRAEQVWRAAGGEAPAVTWSLIKNIPAGAGLGGGSGNAAAALLLLEAIGDSSAIDDLAALALSIGSDLPFFLQQSSAVLLGGRGERLLASTEAPDGWVVVAVPEFSVHTAKVFAALKASSYQASEQAQGKQQSNVIPKLPAENDLVEAAQQAYPELAAFHDMLDAAADFHLSGSGGAHFAYFRQHQAAEDCAAHTRSICKHVFVAPMQQGPVLRTPKPLPIPGQQA
ncbi:MAG: 4-(cytidine 5'-diphospho)-2-C-methyl-D-erythritol kinase [Planctomycetota bacterium]|jgi:4-diphosphocytidyl-2-C-methyl-D-erythritol kinase|nr:4-(cytidine 5'-diphospho)-2-C-methyl-D-erythritol kinase [Planctomycetota bacterium]